MPSSLRTATPPSYLWRNVMPHLEGLGRLVAVDMIGIGESTNSNGRVRTLPLRRTARLPVALWDALDLGDNVTFVLHDWVKFSAPIGPTNIVTAFRASRSSKSASPN